jgi:actin-related protein 6
MKDKPLILTEAFFTPFELRRVMWEVMFEEYEVASLYTAAPAVFADLWRRQRGEPNAAASGIVLDIGHAASYAVPIFDGTALNYAVRRVDVGGKLLTNYLKQLLSARQVDMSDETHVVSEMKHNACYVSRDFLGEMSAAAAIRGASNPLRCRYLLPDYDTRRHGLLL